MFRNVYTYPKTGQIRLGGAFRTPAEARAVRRFMAGTGMVPIGVVSPKKGASW